MNENVTIVFHGFLNLAMLEKKQLVDAINEYFDSTKREPIRAANEEAFAKLDLAEPGKVVNAVGDK